jgi:hypothetical protein
MPEMHINNIQTHTPTLTFLRSKGHAKWRILVFPRLIIMELQHFNISFTWLNDQQYATTYIPQFKYGAENASKTY